MHSCSMTRYVSSVCKTELTVHVHVDYRYTKFGMIYPLRLYDMIRSTAVSTGT
eukprot:SAG11_NODE_140_length_15009_cov_7.342522_15_plen_53_part_00